VAKNGIFEPNWISAPGETIADILEERDLSLVQFAQRMECRLEFANQLLRGREAITGPIARRLESILGGSASFWMTRESQYRADTVRLNRESQSSAAEEWLKEIPLRDMISFGWIKPVSSSTPARETACLSFFHVPDVGAWREKYRGALEMAVFRTSSSFDSQPGAVAAWLRQGEIEAASIDCKPWDAQRFRRALSSIRPLTRKKDPSFFFPELQKRCAECGVAVVIVPAPTGCRASGATRFVSTNKALLLLSFRYLSDDHFWFTFFHEAGHLLLHGQKALFLESAGMSSNKEEGEANEFAARVLIPPELQAAMLDLGLNGREAIRFARLAGVSPGIVVGQLQHHGKIKRNQLNTLKRRYRWGSD
jgi:HTH-type transcriptional regulator / antitoxin HigA